MEKLKCSSCGGNMTIDDSKEFATCDYCGTKYKLNEDLNVNIKLDDNVKEVLDNGISNVGKSSKLILIVVSIFIIFFIISAFVYYFSSSLRWQLNSGSYISDELDDDNEFFDEFDIKMFNLDIEMYSGTQSTMFVEHLLDSIVTSNKTNSDKLITVVYGDISTTDSDAIVDIKHSLDSDKYEISLDYDSYGYINKITIENL